MESQQRFYLDAMGIQLYELRDERVTAEEAERQVEEVPEVSEPSVTEAAETAPTPVSPVANDGLPAWLDEAPLQDVPVFDVGQPSVDESDFMAASDEPVESDIATLDWPSLQQRVSACEACPELVTNRSQTVFGVGNNQADWMIIGEAPGADEDRQGEPFVGKAGQLLNAMLNAIGLKRERVYIANVLKCRPPNNRDPEPVEAAACEAFLKRQIALVQPKVILVVGRIAAQNLLKVETPIGKLRGSVHRHDGIPVVVTYHPAYLLRSPSEKRKSWADLCLAQDLVESN